MKINTMQKEYKPYYDLWNLLAKKDLKKELIELIMTDNEFWSKESREDAIDTLIGTYNEETIKEFIKRFNK